MYLGMEMPKIPAFLPGRSVFYQFPGVWDYLGYAGNWMVFFFLGVMVIYIVTLEVTHKTMRQTIINGMTRRSFFISKLLVVLILSLIATLYYTISACIFGIINSPSVSVTEVFDNDFAIPRFFLMSISYLSFALVVGFLLKRSGVAVFVYISYIMFIEPMLRRIHGWILGGNLSQYYPMNVTEDLVPNPFFKYAEFLEQMDGPKFSLNSPTEAVIGTVIFVVLWTIGIYSIFAKRDL